MFRVCHHANAQRQCAWDRRKQVKCTTVAMRNQPGDLIERMLHHRSDFSPHIGFGLGGASGDGVRSASISARSVRTHLMGQRADRSADADTARSPDQHRDARGLGSPWISASCVRPMQPFPNDRFVVSLIHEIGTKPLSSTELNRQRHEEPVQNKAVASVLRCKSGISCA